LCYTGGETTNKGEKMKRKSKDSIEAKKLEVKRLISRVKPHPMGHGFLWGYVDNKKTCLGGFCAANFDEVQRLAESVEGVTDTWIAMD
jgi:hypothetical protein